MFRTRQTVGEVYIVHRITALSIGIKDPLYEHQGPIIIASEHLQN
jgi:hypothetical protein